MDEEARAGLPLRSQLQDASARIVELEALQRQADEDKSDLLDYIQVAADPAHDSLHKPCLLQSAISFIEMHDKLTRLFIGIC